MALSAGPTARAGRTPRRIRALHDKHSRLQIAAQASLIRRVGYGSL